MTAPFTPPRQDALDLLRRHADHSSAFLAYNDQTEHFTSPNAHGMIAFRRAGRRHLLQLCGPFASSDADRTALLYDFRRWATAQGRKVTAVQLTRSEAELYAEAGFTVNQLGSSFSLRLSDYSLAGRRFVKTRNMINHARRRGLVVAEIDPDGNDQDLDTQLRRLDTEWLHGKGWHVRELDFLIGQRGGRGSPHRRLFVARLGDNVVAYVTFDPVWGSRPGWLYELTRRSTTGSAGAIESILDQAASVFRHEGAAWLHLGFTPFVGLAPEHEMHGSSELVSRLVGWIARHGKALYPSASQASFKQKWRPDCVDPEYLAFDGGVSAGAVWQLLRVTRAL